MKDEVNDDVTRRKFSKGRRPQPPPRLQPCQGSPQPQRIHRPNDSSVRLIGTGTQGCTLLRF